MMRYPVIEVQEPPERVMSNFVLGISKLIVRIPE